MLDPHHLEIVRSVVGSSRVDPVVVLRTIGGCETLLAVGILSGLFHRFVSYFQIAVIFIMNVAGAIFGGGAIAHPFGLIVSNLPTMMCALIVALRGPGAFSLSFKKNEFPCNR